MILHIIIGGGSLEAVRPFEDAHWLVQMTKKLGIGFVKLTCLIFTTPFMKTVILTDS